MRSCIGRLSLFSALIPLLVVALCLLPQAALGRNLRPARITEWGEIVSADPAEDPHGRVEPMFYFGMLENQGSGGAIPETDSVDRSMLGQNGVNFNGSGTRSSRVYNKLLIMLRLSVGAFVPY